MSGHSVRSFRRTHPTVAPPSHTARLVLLLVVALVAVSLTAPLAAAGAPEPVDAGLEVPSLSIPAGKPTATKLDSSLWDLAGVRDTGDVEAAGQRLTPSGLRFDKGRVEVIVEARAGAMGAARQAVRAVGATETGTYEELIRAWVPPARLTQLSENPAVSLVRPPSRPYIPGEEFGDNLAEGWTTLSGSGLVGEETMTAPWPEPPATTSGTLAEGDDLFADGFETWPGPWSVGAPPDTPTWGPTGYRKSAGSYSAYCAGSAIAAPGPYADYMEAWLVAGPFDLSSLTEGTLTFDLWLDTEMGWDWLTAAISTNGTEFADIDGWSGTTGEWVPMQLDLANVGGTSYLGRPAVWIGFVFESDGSITDEGAYLDQVRVTTTGPVEPDPVVSEGVAETGGARMHAEGIDGTGVPVGVIDGGFAGYQQLLGRELPSSVVTWGASSLGPEGSGSEVHGTAVAEVVYDMAPGAQLHLAQVDDEVDLGNAAAWMRSRGVKVVNMSMGFFGFPRNGTGTINDIVTQTVTAGNVFWANAAGNERTQHWSGNFRPLTEDPALHSWNGTSPVQRFSASAGSPVNAWLTWNDNWNAASQDYELFLLYLNGAEWVAVGSSENYQNGSPGNRPLEALQGSLPYSGTYGWAIVRYNASRTDVDFDFFDYCHDLEFQVRSRSFGVPADNPSNGFMAAAAVERPPTFSQAVYSSEGPTRDGRLTPHMSGPTDTASATYGSFPGTSSSSPHLAGAAALIRQEQPSLTAADVQRYFERTAIDLGTAGPDSRFGHGRINLVPGTVLPALACPPGQVPVAPFTDVSRTGTHTPAIDCAVWYGIARGTTSTTYAPTNTVNRAQMASFIARLIEAGGSTLPPATPQGFTDLGAAGVHATRINQLAAAGIVRGTSPTTYSPLNQVTRAQMATFLVNAYEYVSRTQLPAGTTSFTDIAGNTHETNIRKAATADFARGTTPTTYAPANPVRRDQMASFLTRVLERYAADGNTLRHLD
jgi:hypothetical protein